MSFNSFVVGVISERAALAWLKRKFPGRIWGPTDRFSREDLSGVDIIGASAVEKPVYRYVQIKSSERYLKAYSEEIEVLIIPQDDREPYFVDGGE